MVPLAVLFPCGTSTCRVICRFVTTTISSCFPDSCDRRKTHVVKARARHAGAQRPLVQTIVRANKRYRAPAWRLRWTKISFLSQSLFFGRYEPVSAGGQRPCQTREPTRPGRTWPRVRQKGEGQSRPPKSRGAKDAAFSGKGGPGANTSADRSGRVSMKL